MQKTTSGVYLVPFQVNIPKLSMVDAMIMFKEVRVPSLCKHTHIECSNEDSMAASFCANGLLTATAAPTPKAPQAEQSGGLLATLDAHMRVCHRGIVARNDGYPDGYGCDPGLHVTSCAKLGTLACCRSPSLSCPT